MKKITSIKNFTIILSIGTIISYLGKLPFRFIALNVLSGSDYYLFGLILQTFNLLIPIGGLNLHSPFTRELRTTKSSENVKLNFSLSYFITGSLSFILMLIMGVFFLKEFSFFYLVFFSLSLFLRSLSEYFIAIVRSKGLAVKSAMISSIPGIFQGIIIIPLIFNIQNLLVLDFFIYLYCFHLISYFFIGLFLIKPNWKSFLRSIRLFPRKINLRDSLKNIKNSSFLSVEDILNSLANWLLIFIATQILSPDSFKIFDLCLFLISFYRIFSSSLLVSTFTISDTEKVPKKRHTLYFLTILGLIITLIFFIIIQFIPLEWLLDLFFNINLSLEGKNIIAISVFIPLTYLLASFLSGKIQALGKYQAALIASCLSFLGYLMFLILGYFINSVIILMFGLIINKFIKLITYYYFIYHSKL